MSLHLIAFAVLLPASLAARVQHGFDLDDRDLDSPSGVDGATGYRRCSKVKIVGEGLLLGVTAGDTGVLVETIDNGMYTVNIDRARDPIVIVPAKNVELHGPQLKFTPIQANKSGDTVMRFLSDLTIKVSRQGKVISNYEKSTFEFKPEHIHKEFMVNHVSRTCNDIQEPVFVAYDDDICGTGLFTQPVMTCSGFTRKDIFDDAQAALAPFSAKALASPRGFGLELEFVSRPNPRPHQPDEKSLNLAHTTARMAVLMGMISSSDVEWFVQEQLQSNQVKPVEECFMSAALAKRPTVGKACASLRDCGMAEYCKAVNENQFNVVAYPKAGEDPASKDFSVGDLVHVTGVRSHVFLNDLLGVVVGWMPTSRRWRVRFTFDEKVQLAKDTTVDTHEALTKDMKAANLGKVPKIMKLTGLRSRKEWNGLPVELTGQNGKHSRWLVNFLQPVDDTESLSVRAANLDSFEGGGGPGMCWPRSDCERGMPLASSSTIVDSSCPADLHKWSWERDTSVKPLTSDVQEAIRELQIEPSTGSIDDEGKGIGFEAVSPVLSGQQGLFSALEMVAGLKRMGIQAGPSSGLHVHVNAFGDAPGRKLTQRGVAGVWAAWAKYQLVIDELLSPGRQGNHYASRLFFAKRCPDVLPRGKQCSDMPCTCVKTFFKNLRAQHSRHFRNAQDFCNKVHDLAAERNLPCNSRYPHQRYFQVNLIPLSSTSHGTIEFRVHSATYDMSRIAAWVKFLVAFVELFGTETTLTDPYFREDATFEEDYEALRKAQQAATLDQLRDDLKDRWGPDNMEFLVGKEWERTDPICRAQVSHGKVRLCHQQCEDESSRRALADWEQDMEHRMGEFPWDALDKMKKEAMANATFKKKVQVH